MACGGDPDHTPETLKKKKKPNQIRGLVTNCRKFQRMGKIEAFNYGENILPVDKSERKLRI